MTAPTVIDAKTPGRTHYKRLLENEHLGQWDLSRDDGTLIKPTVVIQRIWPYRPEQRRKKKKTCPNAIEPLHGSGCAICHGKGITYEFEKNNKYVVEFVNKRKRWIIGPTVQAEIAQLYGPTIQDWIGKKITIYVDTTVTMKGKKTGGIRVWNVVPTGEPTDDPLDREVDASMRALQDQAFGREDEAGPDERGQQQEEGRRS
jgi:hypothetical protein